MLNLVKMNREATLPNALRWWWKHNTKHDPLKDARWSKMCLLLMVMLSLTASAGFALSLDAWGKPEPATGAPWSAWSLIFLIVGVFGLFGALSSVFLLMKLDERAGEFSNAVELFCEAGKEEALPQVDFTCLTRWSERELVERAGLKMRAVIGEMLDLQDRGLETDSNNLRRDKLAPLHQTMWKLGIADLNWDRYFREEKAARLAKRERESDDALAEQIRVGQD